MNRRQAVMLGIAGVIPARRPVAATPSGPPESVRYMQWTGYHWVEIVDGIVMNVHDGEQWYELRDETLATNLDELAQAHGR